MRNLLPALFIRVVFAPVLFALAPLTAHAQAPPLSRPGGNCVMRPLTPDLAAQIRGEDPAGLERRGPLVVPRLPALDRRLAPALQTPPSQFIAVIMMDFTTRPETMSQADVQERMFSLGSDPSVRNYYRENSSGQFDLTGIVLDWVHSVRQRVFYSVDNGFGTSPLHMADPYDRNVWGAIHEAVDLADPFTDFAQFDGDGDGVVDAAIFVLAGRGAEDEGGLLTDFWSHKFDLRQCLTGTYCPDGATPGVGLPTDDGVSIGPYVVVPDIGELGVWCHEYGHILGLPDLYYYYDDPIEGEVLADPLGLYDIMDAGAWLPAPVADPDSVSPGTLPCHFSAWCKYTLGWLNEPADSADGGSPAFDVTLPPVEETSQNDAIAVRVLANPGGANWTISGAGNGRYFLIENRQDRGFDRGLYFLSRMSARADSGGLLITFVNEGVDDEDVTPSNPLVTVVQADGEPDSLGSVPMLAEGSDLWPRAGHIPDTFSSGTASGWGIYDAELAQALVTGIEMDGAGGAAMTVDTPGSSVLMATDPPPVRGNSYAYPNPVHEDQGAVYIYFNPPSGDLSSYRARILTLSGALIRTLDQGSELDLSEPQAIWNFRDEGGSRVASGLYMYVIESGSDSARGVIAFMH